MSSPCLQHLEKLQQGEEAGLRYFMRKWGDPLRFFAFKRIKNLHVAEEIVSEAFLKLWHGREHAASVASAKSFLYTVIQNACYDFLGSAHHNKSVAGTDTQLNKECDRDILAHIIHTELIAQIVLEMENLPPQQAEVFRMAFFEGLETKEICAALNTTSGNVYFAKSKAVSYMRAQFQKKEWGLFLGLMVFTTV